MRSHYAFLAASCVGVAHADLTCLGWGVVSPLLGIVCAFKPEPFHKADQVIVSSIESTAEDLKDLGEFDLTHNPPVLAYNYIDTAAKDGLTAANAGLKDKLDDFVGVSIGFGEQAVNTAVTLLEWTHFDDLWYCLFLGAIEESRNRTGLSVNTTASSGNVASARKRATKIDNSAGEGLVRRCATEKWQRLTQPLVFRNISDPNGKVGATIANIAVMLVPVGEGAKVGEEVAAEAYDLAVAGSEDTTRIVKWLPDEGEGAAGSFASEDEALAVKEKLKDDPEWPADNCAVCNSPLKKMLKSRSARSDYGLQRRGGGMSICCKAPDMGHVLPQPEDGEFSPLGQNYIDSPYFSSLEDAKVFSEAELAPPPNYIARDWSQITAGKLLSDLDQLSTSLFKWPAKLTDLAHSNTFFRLTRDMFEEGPEGTLWQKFHVERDARGTRASTHSDMWLLSSDPDLKPWQDFANAAIEYAVGVTKETLGPEGMGLQVKADVELFWTPPGTAVADADRAVIIGSHTDPGYLIFASADQPGLVINNGARASRITPQPDTFQVMAGKNLPIKLRNSPAMVMGTTHAVFGPEITEFGRVSMTVTVKDSIFIASA